MVRGDAGKQIFEYWSRVLPAGGRATVFPFQSISVVDFWAGGSRVGDFCSAPAVSGDALQHDPLLVAAVYLGRQCIRHQDAGSAGTPAGDRRVKRY